MSLKKLSYVFFALVLLVFTSCGGGNSSTYTVTYSGNGSTGGAAPTDANNYEQGATVTVASVGNLVKTGETFVGWNTAADGTGTARAAGSTFAIEAANVTLYAQWAVLVIGDSFQGGVVAYILQAGDPGYVEGEQHGLIAAASDQSTGAAWVNIACVTNVPVATALGTGNQNTTDITTACATAGIAARVCSELDIDSYTDWYLPSQDELNKLYAMHLLGFGSFAADIYWSSSAAGMFNNSYCQSFDTGAQSGVAQILTKRVRCIRSF